MSIKLMTAIFATKFRDLKDATGYVTKARTAKSVLLALADQANDDGEGAYPSLTRMEIKTELSRETLINVYRVLVYNGIITLRGRSKFRTHNYTINRNAFPGTKDKPARLVIGRAGEPGELSDESSHLTDVGQAALPIMPPDESSHLTDDGQAALPVKPPDESSHLTDDGQAALPSLVKPLYLNPYLTSHKPLNDDNDEEKISAKLRMLSNLYETTIGAITPLMADLLRSAAIDYPEEWFEPAFEAAVKNNVRRWVYVETILDGWQRNGFGWKPGSVDPARSKQIFGRTFNPRRGQNGEDRPRYKIPEYSEGDLACAAEINRKNALEELKRLAEGKKG